MWINTFFLCFYQFEDLLKGRPLLWLFTPGVFHDLYHLHWRLVHRQDRSTQWRRFFELADNLCQHTHRQVLHMRTQKCKLFIFIVSNLTLCAQFVASNQHCHS